MISVPIERGSNMALEWDDNTQQMSPELLKTAPELAGMMNSILSVRYDQWRTGIRVQIKLKITNFEVSTLVFLLEALISNPNCCRLEIGSGGTTATGGEAYFKTLKGGSHTASHGEITEALEHYRNGIAPYVRILIDTHE